MILSWLLDLMSKCGDQPAMYWHDQPIAYSELVRKVDEWHAYLDKYGLKNGQVVALDGDYSPNAVAAMLALIKNPIHSGGGCASRKFFDIAQVEGYLLDDANQDKTICRPVIADHPFVQPRDLGDPGLVLFSSGSTGKARAPA
jgi:acyl-coenzyme A synthetase/AMP-(fatty) acid ligase